MSSKCNVTARANLAPTVGSARCTDALVTDNSNILYTVLPDWAGCRPIGLLLIGLDRRITHWALKWPNAL